MNCKDIRETLPDVASGAAVLTPELNAHLSHCDECAGTFADLQATMALLDEWKTPEPSPYFDVRLQAKLREAREQSPARVGLLQWFRRPAFSIAATLLVVGGIGLGVFDYVASGRKSTSNNSVAVQAPRGTAVGDLQFLDKHSDLLQNFDALDALNGTDDDDDVAVN
ncbi:MAG TPA: hypothetical protein VF786_15605 [Terriglobales bacterium]